MLALVLLGPAVPLPQGEETSALAARRPPIKRLSGELGCPTWDSISGDALLSEWCASNCAAGNCPEDKCKCVDEQLTSDGSATQQASDVPPAAASSAGAAVAGPNITLRDWIPRSHIVCHTKGQCDLDLAEPELDGPFALAANRSKHLSTLNGCQLVVYTVSLDTELVALAELAPPPPGSEGCAFAFLVADRYLRAHVQGEQSRPKQYSSPEWIPIEVRQLRVEPSHREPYP